MARRLTALAFLRRLKWLDGSPLIQHVEPYRQRLFRQFFDTRDEQGRLRYNLGLFGRSKKNWKTADADLTALYALCSDPQRGYDNDVSTLANDLDQARDDLDLGKKLVRCNPVLDEWLAIKKDRIERRDGRGYWEVLPAGDVKGAHGKSKRLVIYDEIHSYRDWDIIEAMQPDPHRLDAQQLFTTYASLFHRPGAPLFDMMRVGRAGSDPRMLFSWYAGDYCTDPAFVNAEPEARANPSRGSWADQAYLEQQRRRLPAHKYRRLHLNLPGLPEGSAFQPEPVMEAIDRGVSVRPPEEGLSYFAFVDMSGGSVDDAVLAIGHQDADDRAVLDRVVNQGARPPFDPNKAVERFVGVLRDYGVSRVVGDRYAGQTFRVQFEEAGVAYEVADRTTSQLYEALEPRLNSHQVLLPDVATLEQQLLGLAWRGGKISHQNGEHDDWATAAAGLVQVITAPRPVMATGHVIGVPRLEPMADFPSFGGVNF